VFGFYQALPSQASLRLIFQEEGPDEVHHHYLGFLMKQVCAVAEKTEGPTISTYHLDLKSLTQPLLMRPFSQFD